MGQMTVKFVNPLGEYDTKYGQRYYGKAHDIDMDISFNLMNPVNFEDGDEIEYDSKEIKEKGPQSKNPGEEYIFLKKVKRSGSGDPAQSRVSPIPTIKESSTSAADKYLKDVSDHPIRIFLGCMQYADFNSLLKGGDYLRQYLEFVQSVSNELLTMTDNIRGGSQSGGDDSPQATNETKPQSATGYAKAKAQAEKLKGKDVTEDFDESDVPNFDED